MTIEALTLEDVIAKGAPKFAESDANVCLENLLSKFQDLTGREVYRGQSEMFVFEAIAYALALRGGDEQVAHENNLVAFALEPYLVAMGANKNVYQLQPSYARTTLRFVRVEGYEGQIIVPAGTTVTANNGIVSFSLEADLILDGGVNEANISAISNISGVIGNGFAVRSINLLQSPIAGIAQVYNVTESGDGADIEDTERLRYRMAHSSERISNAGPGEGYKQDVLDVNPEILDIYVDSPQPCYIDIYLLMSHVHANEEEQAAVLKKLDPETGRPMGDRVAIKPLEEHGGALDFIVWFEGDATAIQEKVKAEIEAVFDAWRQVLGGYVAPLAITSQIKNVAGVIHAEAVDLIYQELPKTTYRNFTLGSIEMREA